jgi:peptidoglycan-N-acetylglucosamine deacetylase
MTVFLRPPAFLQRLSSPFLCWSMPAGENKIYLTFDDGPCPEHTLSVLKTLENHNAKATFFVLGENAERHPCLIQAMENAGHHIAGHGYRHLDGWFTSCSSYVENVVRGSEQLSSRLFRPPFGRIRPDQIWRLKRMGFHVVMWSLLSGDYSSRLSPHAGLEFLLQHTSDGNIIVFHDSAAAEKSCSFSLPRFLEHFSRKGFHFHSLPNRL